jgi:hypothetical protein
MTLEIIWSGVNTWQYNKFSGSDQSGKDGWGTGKSFLDWSDMDSTIQKVIDILKKYPGIQYTNTDDSISVDTQDENGFPVTLCVGGRELMVSADFWHEHFDKDEEEHALNCFAFLLSDACRIKVEYRGEKPKSWTLESFENGEWKSDSTTGVFNLRFWRPTQVAYFQNRLIKSAG